MRRFVEASLFLARAFYLQWYIRLVFEQLDHVRTLLLSVGKRHGERPFFTLKGRETLGKGNVVQYRTEFERKERPLLRIESGLSS